MIGFPLKHSKFIFYLFKICAFEYKSFLISNLSSCLVTANCCATVNELWFPPTHWQLLSCFHPIIWIYAGCYSARVITSLRLCLGWEMGLWEQRQYLGTAWAGQACIDLPWNFNQKLCSNSHYCCESCVYTRLSCFPAQIRLSSGIILY